MNVKDIIQEFDLKVWAAQDSIDRKVSGGYCSDLLSDVISGSSAGNVWITLQVHQNIVAVAVLNDLAAIIIINGRQPDPDTITKAEEEKIPLLGSSDTAFNVCGRLHELGISGNRK
jgi:predicted transcriptional regulator